jgi:putative ABC transport system substrate-binding protein
MKKKVTLLSLCCMLLALSFSVEAQQAGKVYRLGYLTNASEIRKDSEETRNALRELGYVEGRNLAIEWRFSKGQLDRLSDFASELVNLNLDCIVALGVAPTRLRAFVAEPVQVMRIC